MSHGIDYLHSHSGLERELSFPKNIVLVDAKYKDFFKEKEIKAFKYDGIEYYKVPILSFVKKNGQFKNLKA